MTQILTKSAQSVQDALDKHNISCKVRELSDSTRTAQEAATAVNCDVAQITKSLIFKTKESHQPVLILASGANRVNEKTIEAHLGEKITRADADFVREVTGFAIGGIPPLGHKQTISHVFIDQDLLQFSDVWAAAGTPNSLFNIASKDLVTVTSGRIISITQQEEKMSKIILYIATSSDDFIADKHGSVDWLPHPKDDAELQEVGYDALMQNIQIIVMGRKSYQEIVGFGD